MTNDHGYPVELVVLEQRGTCEFGHQVGDRIVFDTRKVTGEICPTALAGIMPTVYALQFGIEFPWARDNGSVTLACPDAENPVIFQARRVRHQG
jgi:uncharacterized repeat protein (TIGR04076 family)